MRAFFFDLDDTLFDHRHSTRAALAEIRERLTGLQSVTLDELDALHGVVLEELHPRVLRGEVTVERARIERLRRLVESRDVTVDFPSLEAAAAAYREAYLRARRAVPGALALLRALRSHGAIGVISNNLAEEQRGKLEACGLRDLVDVLVVSEEAGVAKPDPEIFRRALRRAGSRPEDAVMIGDSWSADILGARAAGIRAVWYNSQARPCPEPGRVSELAAWEPLDEALRVLLGEQASG
jgi:putative hydrolase of the HAD superfamily